jgi:thiol-disulfide isomerase/thioredoxin
VRIHPIAFVALLSTTAFANLVTDVREALTHNDFPRASELIRGYRASNGTTSEMLEAQSWVARTELAAKRYDAAEKTAEETYRLGVAASKKRPLDRDPSLATAVGASIEVQANVFVAHNQRTEAVTYLQDQIKAFYTTPIRTRLQKNLNLLTLEGKPAPVLEKVALVKGKPALLFFWAHWCGDCKAEEPILERIKAEFEPKGLTIVAPTQKYGYVAGGVDAPADVELRYIEQIRRERYAGLITSPAPVSEENFRRYGASTTPTLVLIDRAGIVRLYHPGAMTYEELRTRVASLMAAPRAHRAAASANRGSRQIKNGPDHSGPSGLNSNYLAC